MSVTLEFPLATKANVENDTTTDDEVFPSEKIPSVSISHPTNQGSGCESKQSIYSESSLSSSPDILKKVVSLIEYYMSDKNLVKDLFLLKHVTKHKEGYVSIKLMTNYKKVKRFTKASHLVAQALMDSETLEVSEDMTKVRRKNPLPPEVEEDTRSFRTIFIFNIPNDIANISKLSEIFSKFGDMNALRLLKPEGKEMYELKRNHPGISTLHCAVVEYEKVHCARLALKTISGSPEYSFGIAEFKKNMASKLICSSFGLENESCYYSNSEVDEPFSPLLIRKYTSLKVTPASSCGSSGYNSPNLFEPGYSSYNLDKFRCSSPVSPTNSGRYPTFVNNPYHCLSPRDHRFRPHDSDYPYSLFEDVATSSECGSTLLTSPDQSRCSSISSGRDFDLSHLPIEDRFRLQCLTPPPSPFMRSRNVSIDSTKSAPSSPWMRRRFNEPMNSSNNSPIKVPELSLNNPKNLPDNVIRLPKGPNGTRGFGK